MNKVFKNSIKIIELENEIEEISNKINDLNKIIKKLRKDKKDKIKLNYGLTIIEFLIAIVGLFSTYAFPVTIFYMLSVLTFIKLIDIKTFGTFTKINKKLHKLSYEKETLLNDYRDLKKNLYEFKLFCEKEDNIESDNNKYIEENKLENNKVKKLILSKPNEN